MCACLQTPLWTDCAGIFHHQVIKFRLMNLVFLSNYLLACKCHKAWPGRHATFLHATLHGTFLNAALHGTFLPATFVATLYTKSIKVPSTTALLLKATVTSTHAAQ